MEREVLGRKSPLFGRRTAQILLRPFGYREAALFHPTYSRTERARAYFVCGGVPWYLQCFGPARSVETNLVAAILDEHGPLRQEPEFLLREELREVDRYYAVLLAIARGAATASEIARDAGIGDRALHYYLDQLAQLGYVRKRQPLTGARAPVRLVRYSLADPLLRFWFRFVFPNTSYLAQMGPERTLRDRIRPDLDAYFGTCFEALCREALPVLYARERVTAAFDVGEYWDKRTQIDVVGVRDDGVVDLGECKWGRVRSAELVERELVGKASRFPNPRDATLRLRAFTRDDTITQRAARASQVRWHDLADLYA
jgi:AAA+ ATPase superfamily predicted ATPase